MENPEDPEKPKKPGRKKKRVKNKEQAKLELIQAVGEIIRTKGYTGLKVNQIAKKAGLDKVLIYRYFLNVNSLIEAYVIQKDFWMLSSEALRNKAVVKKGMNLEKTIATILEDQFHFFQGEEEMQQLILWELSGESPLMNSISNVREDIGEKFFRTTDEYFRDTEVNFRALIAILTAGIYYIILHSRVSTYCGLDINIEKDREEILRTLKQVLKRAFDEKKPKS